VADPPLDPALAAESFCYVTTTGRVTGLPREIEIWFALDGATAYLLSGGGDRSNWVRNMLSDPAVSVRIGDWTFAGRARVVSDPEEDARARSLLHAKYSTPERGLERWRDNALPVAIDLDAG
jgi:deazaflavin-dependent oxidoreductase (nitroreductase family)